MKTKCWLCFGLECYDHIESLVGIFCTYRVKGICLTSTWLVERDHPGSPHRWSQGMNRLCGIKGYQEVGKSLLTTDLSIWCLCQNSLADVIRCSWAIFLWTYKWSFNLLRWWPPFSKDFWVCLFFSILSLLYTDMTNCPRPNSVLYVKVHLVVLVFSDVSSFNASSPLKPFCLSNWTEQI